MWLRIARRYRIGVLEDHLLRYRRGHGSHPSVITTSARSPPACFRSSTQSSRARAHRCDTGSRRGVRGTSERRRRAAGRQPLHPRRSRGGTRRAPRGALQALAASCAIQRGRMIALALAVRVLTRLPRSTRVARLFERRWHHLRTPGEPTDVRCRWGHLRTACRSRDRRQDARPPDPPGARRAGLWQSAHDRVCLGHRRLVIVDPSPDANQPFVSGDGNFVAVFNGEIYTFLFLRRELERAGVSFGPAPTPRSSSRRTRPGEPNVSIGSRGCLPSRSGTERES